RLFDEGFTGFNGREHQKATGFGLYLTKRVLNQLELAISVESQLEVGTTVSITKVQ
ncbi:sensor histidine kinase, partial [Streptococcus suis]